MAQDLRDRAIVITGASSGIGAATARACAAAGMHVVLNARRADRLEAVAADVERTGRAARVVPGSVDDAGLDAALLAAAGELGGERPFAVFSNAGYGLHRPGLEITDDELRALFETNFFASERLLRTAGRAMVAAGRGGHLLACSSVVARVTLPEHSAYAATKAAQALVCSGLRIELAGAGVHVSSVHPITTRTEFFERTAEHDGDVPRGSTLDRLPRFLVQPPERVARGVVACLRRPRPEVWTSTLARLGAATCVAFPRLGDAIMRRAAPAAD